MQNRFLTAVLAGLLALGLGAACDKKDDAGDKGKGKKTEKPLPPETGEYAGSHILLAYKGALRARPDVTRSKDEAEKLAKDLLNEIKKDPKKFEELAKQHSACPSKMKGGSLGKWQVGRMVPEFDQAVAKMQFDEVTGPVETKFGYHLIRREDPTKINP